VSDARGSEPRWSPAGRTPTLLSFEFVGLCLVAFLAVSNVTVFYNLFGHLASLGIAPGLRGLLVGAYSLTAMVLYLVASPFLGVRRAPRAMLVGMAVLGATGWSYLFVHSFWGLLGLRVLNGAGHFLVGAGATAQLVTVIPPERSGQAFGIYSVAILVAYGLVPAAMDGAAPHLPSPAHGYAAVTLLLLPAAWLVRRIGRRVRVGTHQPSHQGDLRWPDIRANIASPSVAILLALNTSYFVNWSSLFYLFKGFAQQKGLGNVGAFFTVLTGLMICLRLLAGRLFDRLDKVWLMAASFGVVALGHLALGHVTASALPLVGALFGLGLGAGYPAINGLMFDHSAPRFRPLNANLMLSAVQGGSFLGPAIGGSLVARHGYGGYFAASVGMALAGAAASLVLARVPAGRRSG
jgi:MFS family permease